MRFPVFARTAAVGEIPAEIRRSYVLRGTSNGLRQTERLKLRLLRTNCVGRDYLDKLRGSGFSFQWITGHLTEQIGIDRPCAGNSSSDISFYCRPIAFKVSRCLHVDLFCDRLQTGFVLNGQTDSIFGMFKAFVASRNDTCFYCGRMLHKTHHVDHVIPRSFIKSDHLWNFVLACPSCNTRKKDQLPNRQKLAAVVTRNKSMSNSDSSIVRLEFKGYNENLLWQLRFPMPISRRGGHGLIPS